MKIEKKNRIDEITEEMEAEIIEQIDVAMELLRRAVEASPDGKAKRIIPIKDLGSIAIDENDLECTPDLIYHQFLSEQIIQSENQRLN